MRAGLAAATAAGLFLLLGAIIVAGWTAPIDGAMLRALRTPGDPGLASLPEGTVRAARWVTEAGPVSVRGPLALLGALWLRRWERSRAAAVLVGAVVAQELLVQAIKAVVHRPRPGPEWALVLAHGTSFPSGHAAGCMTLYPLLGWFLGGDRRKWGAAAGVGLAVAVGLTRVVLGVHWLCDVGAGWLLGAVLALTAAAIARPR